MANTYKINVLRLVEGFVKFHFYITKAKSVDNFVWKY